MAEVELTLTILPPRPPAIIALAPYLLNSIGAVRHTAKTRSHSPW
jgi:hypothetical protein